MKNKYIIPIFVPHKGCPNQCIFCNQKKISGQIKDVSKEDVETTINYFLEKYPKDKEIDVAFYGGSFTAIEKEKQIELLSIVQKYILNNIIKGIRISTRPDCISQDILDYLKQYNVHTIELGVQSMVDDVLTRSLRGHSSADVIKASTLIKENGFALGLQMMVGLPNSTKDLEIYTAREFIKLEPNFVRIYPVLVIKDTPLEEEVKVGKYVPCDLQKAIDISAQIVELFEQNKIRVIRIGLQNTDNIEEGKDVIGGPFHKNFGELVKQKIILNKIEEEITKKYLKVDRLIIECRNINNVIGYKKNTLRYLKQKYNININVKQNNQIPEDEFVLRRE